MRVRVTSAALVAGAACILSGCSGSDAGRRGDFFADLFAPTVRYDSVHEKAGHKPRRRAVVRHDTSPGKPDKAKYAKNLEICLTGKSPLRCDYDSLAPDDRERADAAEYAVNLNDCLSQDRYSLCHRDILQGADIAAVEKADYDRNYQICTAAHGSSLCQRSMLTPIDLAKIEQLEYDQNLKLCSFPNSPLCRRELLRAEDKTRVDILVKEIMNADSGKPIRPAEGPDESVERPADPTVVPATTGNTAGSR